MKEEKLQAISQRYKKNLKESTTNNYMPINWIPRRNGQIFRDMQPAKTGLRRNR